MHKVETIIRRKDKKPIVLDYTYTDGMSRPIVLFCHGFKGFKDWGHFNLIAEQFAMQGFMFVKFNFSHNGTTIQAPSDFDDLEAFGMNNFSIELDDLKDVVDWLQQDEEIGSLCDVENINLMGHSRGGGVSIIYAAEDVRIKKLITWSSVSDFESRINHIDVEQWRETGVYYILNSRTNQEMPWYFQLYEDFMNNKERYNIHRASIALNIRTLIVHGSEDETVLFHEAENLNKWIKNSRYCAIAGANHTIGGKHPYIDEELPDVTWEAIEESVRFLEQ